MGSSSAPRGPISKATRAAVPAAWRATATPAATTCSAVYPVPASFGALAPKVLA